MSLEPPKESEESAPRGCVISFHNLSYAAFQTKMCCKKTQKKILRDVSGFFEPGLNAILGPSGGGKTSLLDLLAQRRDVEDQELSGKILLNGSPLPAFYKHIAGYVVQDDVVYGTLTVRENVTFAAKMRLETSGAPERDQIVSQTLEDLGLSRCADSKVGTALIKGISGGERKRCNIAMELITKPDILYLDEPTTGLDASMSYSVVSILHKLAKNRGCTVVLSIHQPRFSIFRLFDRLHLFSCYGQTVFHGKTDGALSYFANIGFECESFNNPADFYLDKIMENADASEIEGTEGSLKFENEAYQASKLDADNVDEGDDEALTCRKNLPKLFKGSGENKELLEECEKFEASKGDRQEQFFKTKFTVGFFVQVWFLLHRQLLDFTRNPQACLMPSIVSIATGLVCGIVWFDLELTVTGFQNYYGGLIFLVVQVIFSNLAAIEMFIAGRATFLHELSNGYYSPVSFFISKVSVDMALMQLLPTILFVTIFYWMAGFENDFGKFMFTLMAAFITCMAGSAISFFYSVLFGVVSLAANLLTVTLIMFFLYSGLMINVASLPAGLAWPEYLSTVRHSINALSINLIKPFNFCGQRSFTLENGTELSGDVCVPGSAMLDAQNISTNENFKWFHLGMVATYALLFLCFTFIKLMFIKKRK